MRILLIFTILSISKLVAAQEVIYLEQYFRYSFNQDSLKSKVVFVPERRKFMENYNTDPSYAWDWKKNAISAARNAGGNVLKVVYDNRSGVHPRIKDIEKIRDMKVSGYLAEIYHLNDFEFQMLKDSIPKIRLRVDELKKNYDLFSDKSLDEYLESHLYKKEIKAENREDSKILPLKGLKPERFYAGFNAGLDYFLEGSVGLQTELNFLQKNDFDIGVGNKVNGMIGFVLIFQNYTYFYTKMRVGNVYIQPGFGKEFLTGYYKSFGSWKGNNRIDLDFSWKKKKQPNIGLTIPIRLNGELNDFPIMGLYGRSTF